METLSVLFNVVHGDKITFQRKVFILFCSDMVQIIILKQCFVIFNIRDLRKLKIVIGYRCYFVLSC